MKIVCYERYLQKKAGKDKEAATLLYKYQQTVFSDSDEDEDRDLIEDHKSRVDSFKVSNVVNENNKLKLDLKAALKEITRLQEKVHAGGAVSVEDGKD